MGKKCPWKYLLCLRELLAPCRFPQAQLTNQFQERVVSQRMKKKMKRYFTNSETQFSRNVVFKYIIRLNSKVEGLKYEETGSSFASVLVVCQSDLKLSCWVAKSNTQELMNTSCLVLPSQLLSFSDSIVPYFFSRLLLSLLLYLSENTLMLNFPKGLISER